MIPNGWEEKRLSSIANIIMGQSPDGSTYNQDGNGFPLINGPVEFTKKFPVKRQWTTKPTKFCEPGDVLICVRGSTTGRINISNDKYCIGRGVAAIRALEGKTFPDYLEHLLVFEVNQLTKKMVGSTFPSIDKKALDEVRIVFPPIDEQRIIAKILSTWDEGIEMLNDQIQKLELSFTWFLSDMLSPKKVRKEKLKWKTYKLGDFASFINGRGFKESEWSESGLPIIRIQNLNGGTDFNYYDGEYDQRHFINTGDLLFSWSGSRGTSFGPNIWSGEPGLLNQHIFKVLNTNLITKDFLYLVLKFATKIIETKAHGGSGLVHVTKSELEKFEVDLPGEGKDFSKISDLLINKENQLKLLRRKLLLFEAQKRGLMQQLLTGKKRVKGN